MRHTSGCGLSLSLQDPRRLLNTLLGNLLNVFGYLDRSTKQMWAGSLKLRYCKVPFAREFSTWTLPTIGNVALLITLRLASGHAGSGDVRNIEAAGNVEGLLLPGSGRAGGDVPEGAGDIGRDTYEQVTSMWYQDNPLHKFSGRFGKAHTDTVETTHGW